MKKYFKAILVFSAMILALCFVGCGRNDGFDKYETDIASVKTEISTAKDKVFASDSLCATYSYMVTSKVNGQDYELGQKNVLNMEKAPESGAYDINRLNYYYGSQETYSKAYHYIGGKLHVSLYNTNYKSDMTEEQFLEYTDGTEYAVDRDFFDISGFSDIYVKTEDGKKLVKLENEEGELSKKIADFLGFEVEDYTYSINDKVYTATFSEDGLLLEERLTFTAVYSLVNDPNRKVTYKGEFYFSAEHIGKTKVTPPTLNSYVNEVSDITKIDGFLTKSFGVLSTFTTLDAEYDRYVKVSDQSSEYSSSDYVHFTEAYRDNKYIYGSLDKRFYRTPKKIETVKTGVFIDSDGYHYRSTSGEPVDEKELPYPELDMLMMVVETLAGECPLDDDIISLVMTETDDEYIYTYSYTNDAAVAYGEYLLNYFSESGSSASLKGATMVVESNKSVLKVRKSDGCAISHTVEFEAVYDGKISVECDFEMKVNATGDDVKVFTLNDWTEWSSK